MLEPDLALNEWRGHSKRPAPDQWWGPRDEAPTASVARLRPLALTLLLMCSGCAEPEATTGAPSFVPGQVAGGGAQADAGVPSCACYFEAWSLQTACGTLCLGDAKLSCTTTSASVDPRGCAVGGPADGGVSSDGGAALDAGPAPDAGPATVDPGGTCTPISPTCGCTIFPYPSSTLSLTIPCCVTLCVASQRERAWSCSARGVTELVGVPAVCRP